MEGGTKRDESRSTKLRVHTTSSIIRPHKRKPVEIHAHTVQLTSVKGRSIKSGVRRRKRIRGRCGWEARKTTFFFLPHSLNGTGHDFTCSSSSFSAPSIPRPSVPVQPYLAPSQDRRGRRSDPGRGAGRKPYYCYSPSRQRRPVNCADCSIVGTVRLGTAVN